MKRYRIENFQIASSIRNEYISGTLFNDLKVKYNIGDRHLKDLLSNKIFHDINYVKPPRHTNRIKFNEFLKRATIKYGNKYDYSLVENEWTVITGKIPIICIDHGKFYQQADVHISSSVGCYECAKLKLSKLKSFTNDHLDAFIKKNKISILRLEDYKSNGIPMSFKCLICDHIWKTSAEHIKSGTGCPNCKRSFCNNELIDKSLIINNPNIKRLTNYKNAYTQLNWQCLNCNNIWSAIPNAIKKGRTGCPTCSIKKNEKIVLNTLIKYNIEYIPQYKLIINNKKMFVDFFIPKINCIIEYNGAQHYQPVIFGSISKEKSEENFIKQQERDLNLRNYCLNNKINLIEIDGRTFYNNKLIEFLEPLCENFLQTINYGDVK